MSLHHQLSDLGERADQIADVLLREQHHELHRVGVACRDLSLTIVQALSSLPDKAREKMMAA
jgi:hypothetical protein